MGCRVTQHCLALFTRYPFNNLLHHRVAGLVLTALERGSDEFLQFLFGPCALIEWLTGAPETVVPASRDMAPRSGKPYGQPSSPPAVAEQASQHLPPWIAQRRRKASVLHARLPVRPA